MAIGLRTRDAELACSSASGGIELVVGPAWTSAVLGGGPAWKSAELGGKLVENQDCGSPAWTSAVLGGGPAWKSAELGGKLVENQDCGSPAWWVGGPNWKACSYSAGATALRQGLGPWNAGRFSMWILWDLAFETLSLYSVATFGRAACGPGKESDRRSDSWSKEAGTA